jgi:hypothetical protein
MSENIKFAPPTSPPAPLFLGEKERNYVKQIVDEVVECIVGQVVVYYPISHKHTDFHPLYGEAIEKTYLPPIKMGVLVKWGDGSKTTNESYGVDNESRITVGFHKRRATEDQDIYIREGDVLFYGNRFYEIQTVGEPRELFGQADHRFEWAAECLAMREGQFDEPGEINQAREYFRTNDVAEEDAGAAVAISCNGKIQVLSANPLSPDYVTTSAMTASPDDYRGCIVYITEVGASPTSPFLAANKLYFNEGGVWFVSPFILA